MGYLAGLKMLFLVLFLGWLVIWVMLPTMTYMDQWTPKLASKLNTTYIGGQGTNLFLLTFPIMFIAAFGCIYLHFLKKRDSESKRLTFLQRMAFWRSPVLVMDPFGIISGTELFFALLFVALLIWSFSNYLSMSFRHPYMHKQGEKIWQARFRSVWLRIGYVANICWAFLFFPVTRGSSILPLLGLTSESSIKYHIWLGHLSMLLGALHSIGFIIYWAISNQMVEMLSWTKDWVSNVAGEIAFIISVPMWAASFPRIRRKMFEVFYYTHHLYVLYIFFYILHVGAAYFCMILPGIFLFLIDRYLRFLQSRNHARLISARILPSGTVELNFAKHPGLHYNPTSILFINIPRISKLQWHPFTVTSNSNLEPDKLSIAIKNGGSWTRKLYEELSAASVDRLQVSVEGPYGPASSHFLRHESLVLISGGSGITPFISIIREIIFQSNKQNTQVPSINFICAFKHAVDLSTLDLLLPIASYPGEISKIQLQIQAYVTRESQPPTVDDQKLIQTKWFKPNPLDVPITAALGPDSWLWLCLIILSSFVIFLVLLGFLTRYYIYPIDQNIDGNYHFTYRCLWYILFVFVGIFVGTSCVLLWQKRQTAEGKQIQDVEVPTPVASPGSWFYKDREVENLPHQSLVQATQVHYGGRPNLRQIVLECEGSDIGVMVSGPKEMRHDVAKICASDGAKHLHFEYLSFNW